MKQCFKCLKRLPLTQFYVHKMMADGRLGKCKTCAKKDTQARIESKKKELEWVLQERERCRLKSAKYRSLGHSLVSEASKAARSKAYYERYPLKLSAHRKFWYAVKHGKISTNQSCEVCGGKEVQAHHDDYTKPLEVRWLCQKHHMEHHVKMRREATIKEFQI